MASLKGARVLITGGAGLVGSHISDQLLAENVQEIVILDNFVRGSLGNLETALASGKVRVIEGDICDVGTVKDAMKDIDILFHQAAIRITQCAESPRLAFHVLATGTFNVLEAAVQSKVKRVVAASSASVYGMAESFPTTEAHHPYNNRTIYGACKTFNEGLLRSFAEMYQMPYVGLRYFNVYGPRMDIHGVYTEVLVRWMNNIAAGKPPIIFGAGKQTMDFIYIEDIARSNILAAKSDVTDEVFNIASGTETSLLELAETLLKIMGSDLKVVHEPERAVNAVPRRLSDIRAAKERLGFEAQISLEEGLRQLVSWWSSTRQASLRV